MKNGYDPHLLYQAINITVELQYTVPMTLIYNLLLKLKIKRKNGEKEPSTDEVIKLLALIGNTMQEDSSLMEIEDTEQDLQTKIKYMLKLTKCQLNPQDLNKILKGQLSIKDALNKEAQLAWSIMFEEKDGRYIPDARSVSWLLDITQEHVMGKMLKEYNNNCLKYAQAKEQRHTQNGLCINSKTERAKEDPVVFLEKNKSLEEKLRKLRLVIAHLQGYDRDRDGDGERGIDPETGYVRDFDDVFMANNLFDDSVERQEYERDID